MLLARRPDGSFLPPEVDVQPFRSEVLEERFRGCRDVVEVVAAQEHRDVVGLEDELGRVARKAPRVEQDADRFARRLRRASVEPPFDRSSARPTLSCTGRSSRTIGEGRSTDGWPWSEPGPARMRRQLPWAKGCIVDRSADARHRRVARDRASQSHP